MAYDPQLELEMERDRLRVENSALRRRLAQLTAMYIWNDGGSFAKIDREIRQFGFRLVKGTEGHDPKVVPITALKAVASG